MDELNNQNPNEPDNSQNQNNNPYQGADPFANINQDMYQNNDPYASLNPDSQMNNPYGDMNSNPYGNPLDSMTDVNSGIPQDGSGDDIDTLMSNMSDANGNFTPQVPTNDANVNDYANPEPMVDSNINDFDNQGTINPILSQSLPNDNTLNNDFSDVNNNTMPDSNYSDLNEMQNNFANSNMAYQDNNYANPNDSFQGNNFSDPNLGYQNNDFSNNFTDPNANYGPENNGFTPNNPNDNFNQSQNNMNYQSGNYSTDFAKAWMGTLYDKAQNGKFNWMAALFGEAYFLFRKIYLTGSLFAVLRILLFVISVFLITKMGLAALAVIAVLFVIFAIVCGFSFYPLYRNLVKNKLDKMKQMITDNSQLVSEAQKKGNTSVLAVIIYMIVLIISILISSSLMSSSYNILGDSNKPTNDIPEVQEPTVDMQLYNFSDKYLIEYDALTWFLDEENNTMTKGDYTLQFAQALGNVNETFNVDITTPTGRSSLLSTLSSSLEEQAAQLNLSVETGLSNFAMGTNAYYGYVDVIATDTISRYYFILLPDNNVLFQFVLTVNDTSIDITTNTEVTNILTSAYEDPDYEPIDDSDENQNTVDQNIIDNEISNEVSNSLEDENNNISRNEVDNENSNSTSNDLSSDNSMSENTTTSENVSLSDVLG